VHGVHPLHRLAVRVRCPQRVRHMNATQNEHTLLELHLAHRVGRQPAVACIDLARLQRAPEGSGQSATGSRHDVVDGRRVRLGDSGQAVMGGDRAVRAERDRLGFRRQIRETQWADAALDAHVRPIGDVSHAEASHDRADGIKGRHHSTAVVYDSDERDLPLSMISNTPDLVW
jgi:hypothetical protein